MLKPANSLPWNPFPTQWIWGLIFGSELALFLIFYALLGSRAFFCIGPMLTYNLGIYFFPYLSFFLDTPPKTNNRFVQEWRGLLQNHFPAETKIHLFINPEGNSPLSIFAHRSTLWFVASQTFLERFSPEETELLQQQIFHLWKNGLLANATTWTALQKTLPIGKLRNPRGTELVFATHADDVKTPAEWQRLCLKVFHWMSHHKQTLSNASSPTLFFPNLTSYNEKSYFALYQYLQNELISTLKERDEVYEPTKSGSLVFDTDSFHRLYSSDGSRPSPPPSERQN
jgi:hypothetical protein